MLLQQYSVRNLTSKKRVGFHGVNTISGFFRRSLSINLTQLINKHPLAVSALHKTWRTQGYVRIRVNHEAWKLGIRGGLDEAQCLNGFRFPDIESNRVQYNLTTRRCFQSLFDVATVTFSAIITAAADNNNSNNNNDDDDCWENKKNLNLTSFSSIRTPKQYPLILPDAIQKSINHVEDCRQTSATGSSEPLLFLTNNHTPLSENSSPFGQTFFNLFNYGHGMLNVHKDRGLITVIASRSHVTECVDDGKHSKLWMENPSTLSWINLDQTLGREDDDSIISNKKESRREGGLSVIVFLGQAGERLLGNHLGLRASRHAVRVNPTGEYIAHSHYHPDPQQTKQQHETNNKDENNYRCSAAMILHQEY